MQPYKGKKHIDQDEEDHRAGRNKYKAKNDLCPDGFFCQNLCVLNKCKKKHEEQDKKLSQSFYDLKKKKTFVIILQCQQQGNLDNLKPIYLQDQFLPIEIVEQTIKIQPKEEQTESEDTKKQVKKQIKHALKYQPGYYYEAEYLGLNIEKKTIKAKIKCQMCKFGNTAKEIQLLCQMRNPIFKLEKPLQNQKLLTGTIRTNWDHVKVLKNNSGNDVHRPIYFTAKMQKQFPVTEGCLVKYLLTKNNLPIVCQIKHERFKFTGILQVDKHGVFYVKCRNWKYQTIDIPNVPQVLLEKVKEMKKLAPYTILRNHPITQKQSSDINSQLKKYLMKGNFYSWPLNCYQPIGQLQEQFNPFSFKSLKQAVIYEYMINPVKHSQKEKKQSIKLLDKLQKENQKLTKNPIEQYVFTIDGMGTSCHDDAISVKLLQPEPEAQIKQKTYAVGIHISDVDEYIPVNSLIDQEVRNNDKTTYIKGFYNPMFYAPLMKFFSLSHDKNKLTYSLFFKINSLGMIDFNSVQMKAICVKISKNYFHSPKLHQVQKLSTFFELNKIIQESGMLKENSLGLGDESETEAAIDSLMLISSMIPTFMWKINTKRIENSKKKVDEFIKNLVQKIKQLIKQWEKNFKQIKQVQKDLSQAMNEKNKMLSAIMKQVQAQLKKFRMQLKEKKKQEKQIKKKEKKDNKKQGQYADQQSETDEQQAQLQQKSQTAQSVSEQFQKLKQLKQLQEEEDREKKVKEALNKKVAIGKKKQQQDQSQSLSSSSEDQGDRQTQRRKISQAEGALRYMKKIFDILKVDIKWTSRQEIKDKFDEAKRYDESELFKQFIKRMYIMNNQHFRYIIKIQEQINKKQRQNKNQNQNQRRYAQKRENFKNGQPQKKQEQKKQNGNQIQDSKQKKQNGAEDQPKQKSRYRKKQQKGQKNEIKKEVTQKIEQKNQQKDKKQTSKQQNLEKCKYITVKIEEDLDESTPNKKIRELAFSKGRLVAKKQNIDHLIFRLFLDSAIQDGIIKVSNQITCQDLKRRYLSMFLVGIRSGLQLRISEILRNKIKEKVKIEANQLFQRLKKDNLDVDQLKQKMKIIIAESQEQVKNCELIKKLQKAYFIKQLDKLLFRDKKQQKQDQNEQKKQKDALLNQKLQEPKHLDKKQGKKAKEDVNMKKQREVQKRLSKQQMKQFIEKTFSYFKLIEKIKQQNVSLKSQINKEDSLVQQNKYISQQIKIKTNQQQKKSEANHKQDLLKDINFEEISEKYDILQFLMPEFEQRIFNDEKLALIPEEQRKYLMGQILVKLLKKKLQKCLSPPQIKRIQNMSNSVDKAISYKFLPKSNKQEKSKNSVTIYQLYNGSSQFLIKQNSSMSSPIQVVYYCWKVSRVCLQIRNKLLSKSVSKQKETKKKTIESVQTQSLEQKKVDQKIEQNIGEIKQQQIKQTLKEQKQAKQKLAEQGGANTQQKTQVKHQKIQESLVKVKVEPKKNSKKQERRLIEQKKIQLIAVMKQKKSEELKLSDEKIQNYGKKFEEHKKEFKQSLTQVEEEYNILDYLLQKIKKKSKSKKNQKGKKSKKNQKKSNEDKKDKAKQDEVSQNQEDYQFIEQICSIIDEYKKKSGHKFKVLKASQIQDILKKKIDLKKQDMLDNQKLNKQFIQISKDEQQLLKWNNPIRSYDALETMRIIKDFEWVFNGEISPLDILIDYQALKQLKSRISSLEKSKIQKISSQKSDKKHKEANREIQKIEFFYKIKNDPGKIYKLLNVTSPVKQAKFVYHPSLGQIEVKNVNFEQKMFRVVEGRFQVISEFPIEVKAVLIK